MSAIHPERRDKVMVRGMALLAACVCLLCLGGFASAETVKFPVEVSIDMHATYLTDTEICVINLKTTPVKVLFGYYNNSGAKASCAPIPPSITIQGNDTWTMRVGGCFAVANPMPALNLVGIGKISAPTDSVSVYWRIYDLSDGKNVLLDHGKESP
jgi:hypothetical protein